MDISQTTAPKSDQQNFDDYIGGPKTVTVAEVRAGTSEQPVEIHLVEFPGRPYKPSKSMRRVLVAAWGPESAPWVGRRLTLMGDPTVKFGGSTVGGIKISHLSHIDKRLSLSLTVTKGKRSPHVVDPIPAAAPTQAPAQPAGDAQAAPKITEKQQRHLFQLFKAKGIAEADQLAGLARTLGRPIESRTAMTEAEWHQVIDRLEQLPDGGAQVDGGEQQ